MDRLKRQENLRALAETAMMVAVAFILSFITLFKLPNGGSVTPLSMLPIIVIGLRRGVKWGIGGGIIYACLQMLQSFYPPPTATAMGYAAVVFLDYIFAFGLLGVSGLFKGKRYGILFAAPLCVFLRFLCHFASGIVIWHPYAPEGARVWLYSLTYNGSYMGVELAMTVIAGFLLAKMTPFLLLPGQAKAEFK